MQHLDICLMIRTTITNNMSHNIETKARVKDIQKILSIFEKLSISQESELVQEDIYYEISSSKRLKLRNINNEKYVLISYERPNTESSKISEWKSVSFKESERINDLLAFTFGIKMIVKKSRSIYKYQNTEIHLDTVENLGDFIELETKLLDKHSSRLEHSTLLSQLGIHKSEFVSESYSDLMLLNFK